MVTSDNLKDLGRVNSEVRQCSLLLNWGQIVFTANVVEGYVMLARVVVWEHAHKLIQRAKICAVCVAALYIHISGIVLRCQERLLGDVLLSEHYSEIEVFLLADGRQVSCRVEVGVRILRKVVYLHGLSSTVARDLKEQERLLLCVHS